MNTIQSTDDAVSLEEEIHSNYSPDLLDDIFQRYFSEFMTTSHRYFSEWNLDKREYEGLSVRKREIVKLFAITLSDAELFAAWFKQLPYMVSKVFETIAWEGRQMIQELNARTKGDIQLQTENGNVDREAVNPAYCLFLLSQSAFRTPDSEPVLFLDLPGVVRKKCKKYLPKPKGYFLKPLKPLDDTLFLFYDQGKILNSLEILREFKKQGNLELTKSGWVRRNSLIRMQQLTELEEFYPQSTDSALRLIRMEMIASFISLFEGFEIREDACDCLKKGLVWLIEQKEPFCIRFMNHVKGWYHAAPYLSSTYEEAVRSLLKSLPLQKWISVKQLMRYALVRDIQINPVADNAYRHLYLTEDWKGWGNAKKTILPLYFPAVIDEPLFKATLLLYASLGLIDIMIDNPTEPIDVSEGYRFHTRYGGLAYLRLNRLGAFVFGLAETYEGDTVSKADLEIQLENEPLILTLSRADAKAEMALEKLAVRIARLRFKFDFKSFLQDCSTAEDVEDRINLFYRLAGRDLPENWKTFLNEIRFKANAFAPVEDYQVFKIRADDNELIDLLTEEGALRELFLVVEDFHIMVQKRDIAQLRKKLHMFGYLL